MKIALTYNIRRAKPNLNDPQYLKEAEFDEPATINGMIKALETLGHNVFRVEADEDAYLKLKKIKNKIDLVFNVAEGIKGQDREAQLPAMMEMLGIPYTGPRPLSYALGLDKAKAKEIWKKNNVPTPDWVVIKKIKDLKTHLIKKYPVIIKPLSEGSSKGIEAKNLVKNYHDLWITSKKIFFSLKQSLIIEKFLPGREFTVAILGTPPKVLPIIEVTFDKLPKGMPKYDHFEAKWIYDSPKNKFDPLICPAKISESLRKKIEKISLDAFNSLEMKDWARLDLRLDEKGVPNVIEINCPPGIIPDPAENSRFPRAARAAGYDYNLMIKKILLSAAKRYGIKYKNIIK